MVGKLYCVCDRQQTNGAYALTPLRRRLLATRLISYSAIADRRSASSNNTAWRAASLGAWRNICFLLQLPPGGGNHLIVGVSVYSAFNLQARGSRVIAILSSRATARRNDVQEYLGILSISSIIIIYHPSPMSHVCLSCLSHVLSYLSSLSLSK